jgi:hypothetical protein
VERGGQLAALDAAGEDPGVDLARLGALRVGSRPSGTAEDLHRGSTHELTGRVSLRGRELLHDGAEHLEHGGSLLQAPVDGDGQGLGAAAGSDLEQEVLLGGEVVEERPLRDTGVVTDLADRDRVVAPLGPKARRRVPQGLAGAGGPVTVWAGTGLDLAALALIGAAVLGVGGLSGRLSRFGFGWRQILVAPVVAAAVLGVGASVAMAGWFGVGDELTGKVPNTPAVAADQANGPSGNRLLVLTRDADTIGYRLVGREPGPVVRDLPGAVIAPDPSLARAVRITLSKGDATSANAARDALADLGVGFVAFRGASTEPLVPWLNATGGMTRLSDDHGLILWRVLPRENAVISSRLRLVDAKGAPRQSIAVTGDHGQTDVSLGSAALGEPSRLVGRRLVVAEPAQWADHARVTFAGRELAAVAGGEQPAYLLPSNAGELSITLAPTQQRWRWGQLGLLLVVLFLAAPVGSTRSRRTS